MMVIQLPVQKKKKPPSDRNWHTYILNNFRRVSIVQVRGFGIARKHF